MNLKTIPLRDIELKSNSRADGTDLSELMMSIKSEGLKTPVIVCKNLDKKSKKPYLLVAGNRRYKATEKLGLKTIKAVVDSRTKNKADFLVTHITENLQRENITHYEMGRYIYQLIENQKLTPKEVSTRLGKPVSLVKKLMTVYTSTPKEYRDKVVSDSSGRHQHGTVPISLAACISNAKKTNLINLAQSKVLFERLSKREMSAVQLRSTIKNISKGKSFQESINSTEKWLNFNVPVRVLASEASEIKKAGWGVTEYIQEMVYGKVNDVITRPE